MKHRLEWAKVVSLNERYLHVVGKLSLVLVRHRDDTLWTLIVSYGGFNLYTISVGQTPESPFYDAELVFMRSMVEFVEGVGHSVDSILRRML